MKLVRGYLGRSLFATTGLVLAVLLSLGLFIEFVGQLDDVGVGAFGILQGFAYALMKTPDMAFRMLPMAVLLGALLGFGALAGASELVALRAAGASPFALGRAVIAASAVLALVGFSLGFQLAPPLERFSRQYRTFSMHGPSGLASSESAWVRDGNVIMNMSQLGDPSQMSGVWLFRWKGPGEIESVARADSASLSDGDEWTLQNYAETRFAESGTSVRRERRYAENTGLSADLLGLSVVRSEALSGIALWRYIRYLRHNALDSRRYEVEFWGRVATVCAIPFMAVLALALAFGQLRRVGTGARMLVGIVIGLAYFLLSRSLADGGEVFDLNPVLVGCAPTLLLAIVAGVMLARAR